MEVAGAGRHRLKILSDRVYSAWETRMRIKENTTREENMFTKKRSHSLILLMFLSAAAALPAAFHGDTDSKLRTSSSTPNSGESSLKTEPARPHSPEGPIGTPIGKPIELNADSKIEGLAFNEETRELIVLNDIQNDGDGDGRAETGEEIQIYTWDSTAAVLHLKSSFSVPPSKTGDFFADGRGLALAVEEGHRILYTLSSCRNGGKDSWDKDNFDSRLWRIDYTHPDRMEARIIDLNQEVFDLRGAEVFDLAYDRKGRIYIGFDASKQAADLTTQRSRGILRFQISGDCPEGGKTSDLDSNCHLLWAGKGSRSLIMRILPANGKSPAHHNLGLTIMEMDGSDYLIGTVEELSNNKDQEIYVAEAETGRGLFKFDAPPMTGDLNTERRLAYGAGVLWVGEQKAGRDQVRRVVIRDHVYEPLIGHKRPRRIQITITTEALCPEGENCGAIYHNFGHPLGNDMKPSQGSWPEGSTLKMKTPLSPALTGLLGTKRDLTYSPMRDGAAIGHVTRAQYPSSSRERGLYVSVFQEDFWSREYRNFVYPHLANNSLGHLKDTDYRLGHLRKGDPAIIDSLPRFHWTHQERIFEDFIDRVKRHISDKYGVTADMKNPYWAARNVCEYILDNYNYPDKAASEDGSGDSLGNVIDFDNTHYANGPAVYKMIMTDPRFNDDIHGRRSGCMAAGGMFLAVMRYMGFPARWMGTSQQRATSMDNTNANGIFYDMNRDGMFNEDDFMNASHGHYTNEVWLGPEYGWQRFDASPKRADDRESDGLDYEDYAYLHSRDSQWELMRGKITPGHQAHAVSSSFGVGHNEHFFMHDAQNSDDCFEKSVFHEATGVYTSACKGTLSYDFVAMYEKPDQMKTRHDLDTRMMWRPSLTFDVVVNGGRPAIGENRVEFTPQGPWAVFEPDARVEIVLRIDAGGPITHKVLKTGISWDQKSVMVKIPAGTSGESFHIQVRKIGMEKFIGGASPKFKF